MFVTAVTGVTGLSVQRRNYEKKVRGRYIVGGSKKEKMVSYTK
jgi:hypothetical protein